jgi:hypothetical protein
MESGGRRRNVDNQAIGMTPRTKLSTTMTLAQFDHGYWYATELKAFARTLGIPSASALRKDEIEKAIRKFLATGRLESPTKRRLSRPAVKDVDLGLTLDRRVVAFTNDKVTKDFLEREAQKIAPALKRKSGTRYRFNRWREEQLARGVPLTYRDLVREYVRLNQTEGRFAQAPVVCYVNFMSDFLAAEPAATREKAIAAWRQVKALDVPNDYRSWAKWRRTR